MDINGTLLSVIIPVYNEERNISRILGKLDSQSLSHFEVIIIDDGSTDKTAELVRSYRPLTYSIKFLQQKNGGAAQARESGIRTSAREYIAVIDCDDDIASDALEKTLSPFFFNDIDISLFNLQYIGSGDNQSVVKFPYYTSEKIVNGEDAFKNCISSWGLHAIGIYRKKTILRAYDLYHSYNPKNDNFINNDEIISRFSFLSARTIFISGGDYFVVNNIDSTTRRVNKNYYKVIDNSYILYYFICNSALYHDEPCIQGKALSLLVSTHWGVAFRYLKWRRKIGVDNVYIWREYLSESLMTLHQIKNKNTASLSIKNKMQLLLIHLIIIKL